jgi:lipoprotein-releasing system permease protein
MNNWAPFEWITALRFLREGRMQTLFIIIGVSIGVAVIVFMSALLAGLQANFIKRVLTSSAHIQLIPADEVARPLRHEPGITVGAIVQRPAQRLRSIDQWQKVRAQLLKWPTITNVSPSVSAAALAVRGSASRSITMTGIEADVYFKIVKLPEYIVTGLPRVTTDDIIVGLDLANDLGVTVGDKLTVTSATRASRLLTISGIFDLGNKGANMRSTYVALRTAQALSNLSGGVTSIDLTVEDVYAAETIARAVNVATGVQADSWIKTNAQFFTAVNAQQTSNTMIRLFVGLSVAFGIASVLVVSVILLQGGLLGFAGSLIGSLTGAATLLYWHSAMRQADGSELFPLVLEPQLFVSAMVLAALTGVAAAAVPALRAAKLDPVVAIRG